MRGGCTVDCGLHSPASGVSACTISPLFGVQIVQANTCKVRLKETAKINPSAKIIHQTIHRTSAEPYPLSDILLLEVVAGRSPWILNLSIQNAGLKSTPVDHCNAIYNYLLSQAHM